MTTTVSKINPASSDGMLIQSPPSTKICKETQETPYIFQPDPSIQPLEINPLFDKHNGDNRTKLDNNSINNGQEELKRHHNHHQAVKRKKKTFVDGVSSHPASWGDIYKHDLSSDDDDDDKFIANVISKQDDVRDGMTTVLTTIREKFDPRDLIPMFLDLDTLIAWYCQVLKRKNPYIMTEGERHDSKLSMNELQKQIQGECIRKMRQTDIMKKIEHQSNGGEEKSDTKERDDSDTQDAMQSEILNHYNTADIRESRVNSNIKTSLERVPQLESTKLNRDCDNNTLSRLYRCLRGEKYAFYKMNKNTFMKECNPVWLKADFFYLSENSRLVDLLLDESKQNMHELVVSEDLGQACKTSVFAVAKQDIPVASVIHCSPILFGQKLTSEVYNTPDIDTSWAGVTEIMSRKLYLSGAINVNDTQHYSRFVGNQIETMCPRMNVKDMSLDRNFFSVSSAVADINIGEEELMDCADFYRMREILLRKINNNLFLIEDWVFVHSFSNVLDHSCLPNVGMSLEYIQNDLEYEQLNADKTGFEPNSIHLVPCVRFFALRDIRKGEKLTLSYISDVVDPIIKRSRVIRFERGFDCKCLLCCDQLTDLEKMRQMMGLDREKEKRREEPQSREEEEEEEKELSSAAVSLQNDPDIKEVIDKINDFTETDVKEVVECGDGNENGNQKNPQETSSSPKTAKQQDGEENTSSDEGGKQENFQITIKRPNIDSKEKLRKYMDFVQKLKTIERNNTVDGVKKKIDYKEDLDTIHVMIYTGRVVNEHGEQQETVTSVDGIDLYPHKYTEPLNPVFAHSSVINDSTKRILTPSSYFLLMRSEFLKTVSRYAIQFQNQYRSTTRHGRRKHTTSNERDTLDEFQMNRIAQFIETEQYLWHVLGRNKCWNCGAFVSNDERRVEGSNEISDQKKRFCKNESDKRDIEFSRIHHTKNCVSCFVAIYCSENCRIEHWDSTHELECPMFASTWILNSSWTKTCIEVAKIFKNTTHDEKGLLANQNHPNNIFKVARETGLFPLLMQRYNALMNDIPTNNDNPLQNEHDDDDGGINSRMDSDTIIQNGSDQEKKKKRRRRRRKKGKKKHSNRDDNNQQQPKQEDTTSSPTQLELDINMKTSDLQHPKSIFREEMTSAHYLACEYREDKLKEIRNSFHGEDDSDDDDIYTVDEGIENGKHVDPAKCNFVQSFN